MFTTMKHSYSINLPLWLITGLSCLWALSSCTRTEVIQDGGGKNSLIYNDNEKSISSVVYTVDEDKVYTFYFSPTKDLSSLNAMLLADNYIKVVTRTPTGSIDLLSEGNSLLYEDIDISSGTSDQVSRSSLSLKLTSVNSITMELDVATGNTLTARYEGLCYDVTPDEDGTIRLDKQIFFYYYGASTKVSDVNDYYLAVTNLESWTGSGQNFAPSSEGYILTLDFYGEAGYDWKDFPDGTFHESDSGEAQTYYSASQYSFVTYCAPDGTSVDLQLTGEPVTIINNRNGTYTVTATFIDVDDNDRTIEYTGTLDISDGTVQSYLPLIGKDVIFDGTPSGDETGGFANAIYYGDVYDSGSGLMSIYIYDKKGSNYEPGGYGMSIMVFTRTFNEDPYIEEGRYTIGSSFERWTALPGVEGNLLGGIIPWGTYVATVDETQNESGYYSFASSGEIVIEKVGDRGYYHISFDLESSDGHTISGEFTGDIPVSDSSDDDDGNDGSTNLETDVEMDLGYLKTATCSLPDYIYAAGLGMIPVSSIETGVLEETDDKGEHLTFGPTGKASGYQVIDIGPGSGYFVADPMYPETGKLKPGDVIRIDLLVEPGTEDKITPGTYTVTGNRYPASMKPGVCVRGYPGVAGNDGTRYQNIIEIIGNGFPFGLADEYKVGPVPVNEPINIGTWDEFACIYGGSITVSAADPTAEGVPQYTFEFNGLDVLQHKITGTWTGPVYLDGDRNKPMQLNADASETPEQTKTGAAARDRKMIPSREDLVFPGWRMSL